MNANNRALSHSQQALTQFCHVAIVEDNDAYRRVLHDYLGRHFRCPTAVDSVEALMSQCDIQDFPEVILMDIELPGVSGIEGIGIVREQFPQTDVIMLTIFEDHDRIFDSLCAGACGYLLKNTPLAEIRSAIALIEQKGAPLSPRIARKVLSRLFPKTRRKTHKHLTDREFDVLKALVDGLSYQEVADRLFIAVDTVRHHVRNIYRKLEINSKAEAINKYWRREV